MKKAPRLRAIAGGRASRGRTLVLDVRAFNDPTLAIQESVKALRQREGASRSVSVAAARLAPRAERCVRVRSRSHARYGVTMDESQAGWTLLLPVEEQELERLGVTREPSTVAFGRRLTFDEMLTVGEILAELYQRTPDRDVNDIQHAVATWVRQADEWFGRGVGKDLAVSMLRFPQHVARATFEPSSEDDQAIKGEMIAAWFDDLEDRVRFIEQLIRDGRYSEAIILSHVYIEGLGNNVYSDGTHSMRNFVRLIDEQGDAERLLLVHPRALLEALPRRNAVEKVTVAVLAASIPLTRTHLVTREELMQAADPLLTDEQRAWLREELWRGTVAGVIHAHMRNNAVKRGLRPSCSSGRRSIRDGR